MRLKSLGEVIAEYRGHPEAKSLGPDGRPCARETVGLLRRRPVRAVSFVYIGKEANELDEVEEGLVHDIGHVITDYGEVDDQWLSTVLPALGKIPTNWLAERCGVDRKTIQRTKSGLTRPRLELQRCLKVAAAAYEARNQGMGCSGG